ncbi:hypothetical protein SRRS_50380 [Sporomusa rhizae]
MTIKPCRASGALVFRTGSVLSLPGPTDCLAFFSTLLSTSSLSFLADFLIQPYKFLGHVSVLSSVNGIMMTSFYLLD